MTLIKSRNIWRAYLGELEKHDEQHAEQQITLSSSLTQQNGFGFAGFEANKGNETSDADTGLLWEATVVVRKQKWIF